MENSHKYFKNHECKYFPCHAPPDGDQFNCLFCYCPLYSLGDECGGNFEYVKNIKVCMGCSLPHIPASYDAIIEKIKEMNKRGQNADTE